MPPSHCVSAILTYRSYVLLLIHSCLYSLIADHHLMVNVCAGGYVIERGREERERERERERETDRWESADY